MKIAALFLMLSLFVVSAFGRQDQDPTSIAFVDAANEEETPYDDEEDYEEGAEDTAEGQTNRDLGWYNDGYSRGYRRYSYGSNDDDDYSYSYGYGYHRPRVVHRRYYRGGKGKGGMGMGYRS
jgi:hypothetical protein